MSCGASFSNLGLHMFVPDVEKVKYYAVDGHLNTTANVVETFEREHYTSHAPIQHITQAMHFTSR